MVTFSSLVAVLAASFVSDKRIDGTPFVKNADDVPEWVNDMVRAAHGDMLPEDTKYRMISDLADKLHDYPIESLAEMDERRGEIVGSEVPVYNMDRAKWLASNLSRADFCDQAREEGFVADDANMWDRLAAGIYQELDQIYGEMMAAISGQLEDAEGEEEPEEEPA